MSASHCSSENSSNLRAHAGHQHPPSREWAIQREAGRDADAPGRAEDLEHLERAVADVLDVVPVVSGHDEHVARDGVERAHGGGAREHRRLRVPAHEVRPLRGRVSTAVSPGRPSAKRHAPRPRSGASASRAARGAR